MAEGFAPSESCVEIDAVAGIVFDRGVVPQVESSWFDPARAGLQGVAGKGGRGAVWWVETPAGMAVLRHYRRGGLVGRLVADRYLWLGAKRTRCWREFELLRHLRSMDLPVPTPVAARWTRSGATYRADLLTLEIPEARTLADLLPELDLERDRARLQSLGRILARFHRFGVCHADLNAHNILYCGQDDWWLIDFDRSRVREPAPGWIARRLARLLRSLSKLGDPRQAALLHAIIVGAHDETVSTAHDY